jgi:tRNA-specific 2-thiouridylase
VFNFRDSFNEQVIARFIKAYENGSTPNPCIDCNRYIKFDRLMLRMKELNMDYVVTGHYARIEYDENLGRYILKKAVDDSKDQSYVLYSLTQEQLKHTLFPLGSMNKTEVRKIAEENGFINAKKHDSQDICFVPNGKYAEFIEQYTGKKYEKGDFVDRNGNVLGEHNGIIRYTIGQRKGLGLALPAPMYVCEKDLANNKVILGSNEDLFSSELDADNLNLITCDKITEPMRVKAKVRYNQKEQPATVVQTDEDKIHIVFDEPQRAISKGQAVVLYDGDTVVGGGTIL